MTSREGPPPSRNSARNTVFAEHAPHLYRLGYSPLPLVGKQVRIKNWPPIFCEDRPPLSDIEGVYTAAYRGRFVQDGIGLATYGGIVIFDIDADGARHDRVYARICKIVPHVSRAPAIRGRRGAKYVLRLETGANPRNLNLASAATSGELEILAHHRQGVLPPTIHPDTGQPYRYIEEAGRRRLDDTHIDDLPPASEEQVLEIHRAFAIRAKAPRLAEHARARSRQQRQAETEVRKWDGDPLELIRAATALEFVDPDLEDNWWKAAAALKNFFGAHPDARRLFDAWSGGGEYEGKRFPGAPDKYNQKRTQDEVWQQDRPRIGLGTLIGMAKSAGFDTTLRQWPALKQKRAQRRSELPQGPFRDAVKAMPRDPEKFYAALAALRVWALHDPNVTPRGCKALAWLIDLGNRQHGYAWPSYDRLATNTGIAKSELYKIVGELENAGYVVRARSNQNPDGSRRTAFALLPAGHNNWPDIIAWHHARLGHHTPANNSFEPPTGQGKATQSSDSHVDGHNGAEPPIHEGSQSGSTGVSHPYTTDSCCSMLGEGGSREPIHSGPDVHDIDVLIHQLLYEVDDIRELIEACSLDAIGHRTARSVRRLLKAAFRGIDGKKPANPDIEVDEEGMRSAIESAAWSAFAPTYEGDRRRSRIDLDLTGGRASRACLRLFRKELSFALGREGYVTDNFARRMQRATAAADQTHGPEKQ